MKYKMLLLLVVGFFPLFACNSNRYVRAYEFTPPFCQVNPHSLKSTITSTDAHIVNGLLNLVKQLIVGVVTTEVVKQTGSAVSSNGVFAYPQQHDEDASSLDPVPFKTLGPLLSLPSSYKYTTKWHGSPVKSKYTFNEHARALRCLFGVPYPSNTAIDQAIRRIASNAIIDNNYLHLPTVRSILEDALYGCSKGEKGRFIRTFFKSDTGLLTRFAVSEFGQKIKIPYAIYDLHNKDLLTKLHDIAYHLEYCDGTYLVEACRAVEYLKGALLNKDQAYRRSCRILFDAYHQLVLGHGCTALVELTDLTEQCCRSFKKELQRDIVHSVAQFCEATTDMQFLTKEEQALVNRQAAGLVNNVNNLVVELKEVDLVLTDRKKNHLRQKYQEGVQGYVDRSLSHIVGIKQERCAQIEQASYIQQVEESTVTARAPPSVQAVAAVEQQDYEDVLTADVSSINYIHERLGQYHATRQEAITAYTNGSGIQEQLSSASHDLLKQHSCSTELFNAQLDTPIQQALQHEFVSIVNTAATFPPLNHDQLAQLLIPTVVHLAEAGAGFAAHNDLDKATIIADCCWATLDCIVAAGEGVVEGGLNTGKSVLNLVRHPVKSITSTLHNLVHLGYQLGKVLHEVGDISVSYVVDPEQGQHKLTAFSDKIRTVCDAVTHKIKTTPPRDLIKGATALLTETWLTGKCLQATVPLLSKALEKAEQAAQIIEKTLDIDNNFQIGDGVIVIAGVASDTVAATTIVQGTQVVSQVLERAGNLYAMARKREQNEAGTKIEWTPNKYKHFPNKNLSWKKIIKSTKMGPAKYRPGIKIEKLERWAWDEGIPVTTGKNWKVYKANQTIGAKSGIETSYMRVEMNTNTIHGHPITPDEFIRYLK